MKNIIGNMLEVMRGTFLARGEKHNENENATSPLTRSVWDCRLDGLVDAHIIDDHVGRIWGGGVGFARPVAPDGQIQTFIQNIQVPFIFHDTVAI
jgi:hypothetical protein